MITFPTRINIVSRADYKVLWRCYESHRGLCRVLMRNPDRKRNIERLASEHSRESPGKLEEKLGLAVLMGIDSSSGGK